MPVHSTWRAPTSGKPVRIAYQMMQQVKDDSMLTFVTTEAYDLAPGDVLVANVGTWYNLGQEAEYAEACGHIKRSIAAIRGQGRGVRLIWRESTPAFFPAPGGLWNGTVSRCVTQRLEEMERRGNFRNDVSGTAFADAKIATLRVWLPSALAGASRTAPADEESEGGGASRGGAARGERIPPPLRHGPALSDVLDCAHMCLPGVPDAWSMMLAAMLASPHLDSVANPAPKSTT